MCACGVSQCILSQARELATDQMPQLLALKRNLAAEFIDAKLGWSLPAKRTYCPK